MMSTKTYSECIILPTFKERLEYLHTPNRVADITFGSGRYLNQLLYKSKEWQAIRRKVILRDCGNDLACEGYSIVGPVLIHHIVPITIEDIVDRNPCIFDLNNLISVSHMTHNAIHYGDPDLIIVEPTVRTKNDTCPWKG